MERCGALGISDRNTKCLTVRDVAVKLFPEFEDYRTIIDEYVIECIQNPDKYPKQREILALRGYDLSQVTFHEAPRDAFLSLYGDYQSQIKQLFRAVENNDVKTFAALSYWERDRELFVTNLTWDSREEGGRNPLPLLHRSVIFHRVDILKVILEAKSPGDSIDFLLDHHKRTALHYASSLKSLNDVRDILKEFGASAHVMDIVSNFLPSNLVSFLSSFLPSIVITLPKQYFDFIPLTIPLFHSCDSFSCHALRTEEDLWIYYWTRTWRPLTNSFNGSGSWTWRTRNQIRGRKRRRKKMTTTTVILTRMTKMVREEMERIILTKKVLRA